MTPIQMSANYTWGGEARALDLDSALAPLQSGTSETASQMLAASSTSPLLANADLAMD